MATLNESIEEIVDAAGLVPEVMRRLQERITELEDEVSDLESSDSNLEAQVQNLEDEVDALKSNNSELDGAKDAGLSPGVRESLEVGLGHAVIRFGPGSGEVRVIESILRRL